MERIMKNIAEVYSQSNEITVDVSFRHFSIRLRAVT
jgi:hypothetical protein